MKKDPMYSWVPSGKLRRSESVNPSSHGGIAGDSRTSDILIRFDVPRVADVPGVIEEAKNARASFGYSGEHRQLTSNLGIRCYIGPMDTGLGIIVILTTPSG